MPWRLFPAPSKKVLPVGIATELIRGDVFFWGALVAAALLASVLIMAVVALDALTKFVSREEIHKLRENGFPGIHEPSPRDQN